MTRRVQDKVSIITGSTSGLGAATAARARLGSPVWASTSR